MITELRVRDLVTVADVTLHLGPGLNVLTGETGAGKSMLADAIALLTGARAESSTVRPGATKAIIEGVFEPIHQNVRAVLETLGLDAEEDRLVIRREVSNEGRSRAWVNGSPTTITALEQLGGYLVDLHGQHQTITILRPETQRNVLDAYAGSQADAKAVSQAFAEVEHLRTEERELVTRRDEIRKKSDYLRHVVQEIDRAKLVPGEDGQLEDEIRRLANAVDLRSLGERLADQIGGDESAALTALHHAERILQQLERLDPKCAEWRNLIDAAYETLEELARQARDYARGIDDDPNRLAELEARRNVIDRLSQKYGATVLEILASRDQAAGELALLDAADFDLETIAARRAAAERALELAAKALTDRRRVGGDRLARGVNRQLPKLGLPGGKFSVELIPLAAIGPHGGEAVQFTVQLNVGLEPRPINKAASGGELSRLMLALSVTLARKDGEPTLVFDEIDQGVGGEVGAQVGVALRDVGDRHQVLVITHLPTIAARADRHLVVSKRVTGGVATSAVETIHGEDRITELARMLGDSDSDSARRHASAMMEDGRSGVSR